MPDPEWIDGENTQRGSLVHHWARHMVIGRKHAKKEHLTSMTSLVIKAAGVWLLLVVAAILNAAFREMVFLPLLGIEAALPLSGISLSILIFFITLAVIPVFGKTSTASYVFIGLLWVCMTVAFEFVFGHWGTGKSWQDIFQVFNVMKGDLFVLVLFTSAVSPWVAARLRGFI